MFFSNFLLTKKGPLAHIWQAGNWDRKLTKQIIYELDVASQVDIVMENKYGPISLRMTAQLLLGIVKIYSRKAKYLLDDCNQAYSRIKLAYRPANIDLPSNGDENRTSGALLINLPDETFGYGFIPDSQLDMAFELGLEDLNASFDFSSSQINSAEITLKNKFGRPAAPVRSQHDNEDPTSALDTPSVNPAARRISMISGGSERMTPVPEVEIGRNIMAPQDDLMDDSAMFLGGSLIPEVEVGRDAPSRVLDESDPLGAPLASSLPLLQNSPKEAPSVIPMDIDAGAFEPDFDFERSPPPPPTEILNASIANGINETFGSVQQGELSIPDIPAPSTQGAKPTTAAHQNSKKKRAAIAAASGEQSGRPIRRRKLIIDEVLCIASQEIRHLLNDPSSLILSDQEIFNRQTRSLIHSDHITPINVMGSHFMDFFSKLQRREIRAPERNTRAPSEVPANTTEAASPLDVTRNQAVPDIVAISTVQEDTFSATINHEVEPDGFIADFDMMDVDLAPIENVPSEPIGNKTSEKRKRRADNVDEDDEDERHGVRPEKRPNTGSNYVEPAQSIEQENAIDAEPRGEQGISEPLSPGSSSKGLSAQGKAALEQFRNELRTKDELSLHSIIEGKSRKAAAAAFFDVLVLSSKSLLVAKQSTPYGDISLRPGPRMIMV